MVLPSPNIGEIRGSLIVIFFGQRMVGFGADYIDQEVDKQYECVKKIGRGLYGIVWQVCLCSDSMYVG